MKFNTFHSSVRPVVTYVFAGAMVAGFFVGKVPSDVFYTIATTVVGYWFGQRGVETSKQT